MNKTNIEIFTNLDTHLDMDTLISKLVFRIYEKIFIFLSIS